MQTTMRTNRIGVKKQTRAVIAALAALALTLTAAAGMSIDFPSHVTGDYTIRVAQDNGRDKADLRVSRRTISGMTRGRDGTVESFTLDLNRPLSNRKRRQTRTGSGPISSSDGSDGTLIVEITFLKKRRGFVKVFGDYQIRWNPGREEGSFSGRSDF